MKRIHIVLVLLSVALVLALGTGSSLYYRLFFLTILVLGGSLVWTSLNLRGVHVSFHRRYGDLRVGQSLETQVTVRNANLLPKFALEVSDLVELPGQSTGAVINLAPNKNVPLTLRTPLRRRGVYTVGAPTVSSRDPFGILRLSHRERGTQQLVVFPRAVDIPSISTAQGEVIGEGIMQRTDPLASTSVATIREYQPGESSRHLHWPSIARRGKLMLKQFDSGAENQIWVLLDMQAEVHIGDEVENTEEMAVTIAASVVKSCSEGGWAVGLVAHGEDPYILPPQTGSLALNRSLLALTQVRAQGMVPLMNLLSFWQSQMARPTVHLVVVTPSVNPEWSPLLESSVRQGVLAAVVLVDPESFGASASPYPLLQRFLGSAIPAYLVRRGEDIAQALWRPWTAPVAPLSQGEIARAQR
ncbi:MAG: DUF58 domain-containing protein [Chloroflexi bacterium]|nr:DUF58 domain-containing protein [Chloroflexota bacterium]